MATYENDCLSFICRPKEVFFFPPSFCAAINLQISSSSSFFSVQELQLSFFILFRDILYRTFSSSSSFFQVRWSITVASVAATAIIAKLVCLVASFNELSRTTKRKQPHILGDFKFRKDERNTLAVASECSFQLTYDIYSIKTEKMMHRR